MPTFRAADGAELAYKDLGPHGGVPLLFLHGWQGNSETWMPVMERLAKRHRTIALDFRGFGASNAAPGPYRVETLADDLSALVAELDLDPLVAIGHSMGAAIAQRFAIDRPEALEALVLVAPVPASGVAFSPQTAQRFRATAGHAQNAKAWLAQLTYREPPREIVALMQRAAAAVPVPVALESFDSWTRLDFAAEAATIETPTLILAPQYDNPDFARAKVADLIAGSRMEIVAEAAHYVTLEQAERVARAIDRFVSEL